ncbi:MAG: DEAD/DEAH box helicase [Gammaproteobacteria bacterium]|jgi:ATP-dependent RNA helicase DeaD|nr:DEAD/DEAH box helicase [Gammaproteobacteria bacterium]MCH1549806.1 DEAD/DEAH box helicase [Pseudomonadales bacterium]
MLEKQPVETFTTFDLPPKLLAALDDVGYVKPSPIQAQAIPYLMNGQDLLGHAPTGTGKTAAFALPLISRVDTKINKVQILTLAPTRELALQVAEAFQSYASHLDGFHVLPVYGGQDYGPQLQQLKRGVHVVVGTPGRVTDHLRRGTLKLDGLQAVVLDEADEMLRMGFIDDVQWILEQTPADRQMALFSATMPKVIQTIARRFMRSPAEVSIAAKASTAETIRQRYWLVGGLPKLDALVRIFEVEQTDGVLIFVRTKTATTELANRLEGRGFRVAALNGDMVQKHREQTIDRLKAGSLDVLVATDVAARGLDVDRISHVVNYDIPYDTEAYVHRIGRTGRAGRAGEAILFVAPRERRMLNAIERATRQKIEPLALPTVQVINEKRVARFKQKITDALAQDDLSFTRNLVEQYQQEHGTEALEVAAALAQMSIGDKPLLLKADRKHAEAAPSIEGEVDRQPRSRRRRGQDDVPYESFRIEVGDSHGVKASNIVGAIANEAGLDAKNIGRIAIEPTFSTVELPIGMPDDVFNDLRKVWICGHKLGISRIKSAQSGASPVKQKKVSGPRVRAPGKKSKAGKANQDRPMARAAQSGEKPAKRKPRKAKK